MKKRNRPIPIMFWVSEDERAQIEEKMAQLGTNNMSAYLRKIAIDGYVVNLDLPDHAPAPVQQQPQSAHQAGP